MRILFFGDVFGRPGREALAYIVPRWKEAHRPDCIIANGENMSHGAGISERSIEALLSAGIQIITGGNHSFEGKNASALLNDSSLPLVRPANMPSDAPGRGFAYFGIKNGKAVSCEDVEDAAILVINLIGQTHMRYHYPSPFREADLILEKTIASGAREMHPPIFVDWHADVSSEKVALGWYLDGRVSAVVGTHGHTPTADARILPNGTGLISDVGMVGPHYSVIGQEITANLERFVRQVPKKIDVAPAPPYEINAVLLDIDDTTKKTTTIRHLRSILEALS